MKCRKCGENEAICIGLCNKCYGKYYYQSNRYNTNLKDFITKEQPKHNNIKRHEKFVDSYTNFLKVYTFDPPKSKTKLAKQLNISRETLYKYIRIYKGGINEKKGKI